MKKSFLIVCAAAAAVFGCKNTFIGDYNTFLNQQTAAESEVPSVVENYFVELESDNGLLLKPSLPFPGEVRATQNVYPDKIEVTWRAVSLPASADSVTYSVYRKNSTEDDTMWVKIAEGLTECKWTDAAFVSQTPSEPEVPSEPTDPGTGTGGEESGGETAEPETPSADGETVTADAGEEGVSTEVLVEGETYDYAVRAVYTVTVSEKQSSLQGSRLSYYAQGTLFRNVWNIQAQYRDNLNQIEINWYPVPGAQYYKVERAEVQEGVAADQLQYETLKDRTSEISYTDYSVRVADEATGVDATKEFRYRVMPFYYNSEGEEVTATPGPHTVTILGALLAIGAPDAPTVTEVSRGDYGSGIKIKWEAMDGMKFRIYRAVSPGAPFEPIATTETGATEYIDTLADVEENRRSNTYYYKVSARNAANIDGRQSAFDETLHNGYGFFIDGTRVSASKRVYPRQIDLIFDFDETPEADYFYVQYTADNGSSWNWVKGDGSTTAVADSTFALADGIPASERKVVVQIPDYNEATEYNFRICAGKEAVLTSVESIFGEDNSELLGRSNGIETTAGLAGPEIPVLTVSQGDSSVGVNKIKVSGKWDGLAEYGDHVDIKIVRYYSFGKDSASTSEPIAVKEKVIADWGNVAISNGEFSITDNLAPDINPTADTIKPMNASIAKGATWTYWTWDREAWKYINRKMPFDMKAAVGCEYKIVARWKNAGSEWPESESIDTTYGYPAISNDDFAHLVLWMREVAMNRLWHLLYPPYLGTLSTIIELLPSPQSKAGEYGGQVGYTAKVDGLGGSGECWIDNYSDWGPEWNINIARFPIAIQFGSTIDFDMNIDIKTPLYDGSAHVIVTLENGMYVDKPRGGSMEVKQADGRSQKYENLQNDNSIILRYFPPEGYEKRVLNDTDSTPSYELTTINFKYPITQWESTRSEDWTMYYGFEFE